MNELQKQLINSLTREEIAGLWRYAPIGYSLFDGPAHKEICKRFAELGDFSPEISKKIDQGSNYYVSFSERFEKKYKALSNKVPFAETPQMMA